MNIDFANLPKAYAKHKEEYDSAINSVVKSSAFIMGAEVGVLEENLKSYTGTKHAISCSNGTDALLLAMMSIGIGQGDEVITTPFTFIATAETIAFLGAKPVFVDIDESTYNIDIDKIECLITKKTKAIISVSLFGQVAEMDELNYLALKYKLPVIEDGAQSFGATYRGKKSCNLSTIGTTSFFPAKPLGCFGDGGAVFTNDDELSNKMKAMRVHGQTKRYHHKYIGMGGRLDTIQAAVLNIKLKYYDEDILLRQNIAKLYTGFLSKRIKTPTVLHHNTSVWAQYSVLVPNRDYVQQELKKRGVPTAVHYPVPLHLQECFNYLEYKKGDFPISEKVAKSIISLPMNPFLSEEEVIYISEQLLDLI